MGSSEKSHVILHRQHEDASEPVCLDDFFDYAAHTDDQSLPTVCSRTPDDTPLVPRGAQGGAPRYRRGAPREPREAPRERRGVALAEGGAALFEGGAALFGG